ncbi:MAG: rRNA maturation RNase YbeY [Thermodesulfovibrionia bacterium]|nr:rRNA maturation RNase YbeY [Thermodesulfovibrionia bacterium]
MGILIKNQQSLKQLNKIRIEKASRKILSLLKHPSTELSILFVDDEKMRQLNADHRGINRTTDVLSFEANIPVGRKTLYPVLGDVVINVQMAASQAKKSGKNFYDEIYHLLVHGILHLLGYDHEKSKYKSLIMRKKEQEILDAVKKMG